jgi:hypothetical protein
MTDSSGYLPTLTREHIEAATSALKSIAALASYPDESGQRSKRRVRVGHIDHGAFLNLSLRSIAMLEVDKQGLLLDAAGSGEVVVAMVVNQPISLQITTLLEFLGAYLARQDLTSEMRSGGRDIGDVDALALSADAHAAQQVQDDLRSGSWEQAARRLADRARNDGFSLEIRFAEPLLEKHELDVRVPLLRRVYNTQSTVREAVDRVAGISLSLHLEGDDLPPDIFRRMEAQLDLGSMKRFSAHLLRDAFVCGNGYLAFGTGEQSPMRLLLPEFVRHVGKDRYEVRDNAATEYMPVEGQVLHLPGAKQVGSDYGLSLLEPFLQISATNETMEGVVQDAALLQPPPGRVEEASAWLKQVIELRERTFSDSAERIVTLLGGSTRSFVDPLAEDLYFPGLQQMADAAERLQFRDATRRGTED